jgi:hypothetical protein
MSRVETIEQEYLVKSFEHFLFQVFEGGFDHIVYEDLVKLQKIYTERSSEWNCLKHIIQEIEKYDDTNDEQKINDVEETATNEF